MHAHRAAWIEANGPIPEGMNVLHHCDNPPCVNVEHLFLGTAADNTQDMIAKGRRVAASGERHSRARLTDDDIREIRRRYAEGDRQVDLAIAYSVTRQNIWRIVHEKGRL